MGSRWWRDLDAAGTIRLAVGSDNDAEDPPETSETVEAVAGVEPTDEAFMFLCASLATARGALLEAEEFRRAKQRDAKKSGTLRRRARREFLEAVDETIDRGTLAAVAHVMYADALTEAEGIAAMARVAPMVVELQAVRPRVYRALKFE